MKKILACLAAAFILSCGGGGGGSSSDEPSMTYLSAAEAEAFFDDIVLNISDTSKVFIMTGNINLADPALPKKYSSEWTALGDLKGTLDGSGYTITALRLRDNAAGIGLFEYVSGTVKNLNINVNTDLFGATTVATAGAVTAVVNSGGIIDNVKVSGTLNGTKISGSVAGKNIGTIKNCFSDAIIQNNTANQSVSAGGLTGINEGTVENSGFIGSVSVRTTDYTAAAGGIAGENNSTGVIKQSFSKGNIVVSPDNTNRALAGGIAGHVDTYATVENCYSTGSVTIGNDYDLSSVGGIAGNSYGTVEHCWSAASLSAPAANLIYLGGIVGDGNPSNSVRVSKNNIIGGAADPSPASITAGGTPSNCITAEKLNNSDPNPAPDADLRKQSTYESIGFVFNTVWKISEGNDYPRFIWE